MGSRTILCTGLLLLVCGPAAATNVAAYVTDQDGKPVANAVVSIVADGRTMPAPATHLDPARIIDQRDETFIPLVTILPRDGRVVFANNDKTKHQVYSFSPIKQFEITLAQGERSPSFAFDKAGVAVLGCNIHDHMIAYVFVSDSPWTAITGPNGRTVISDVPPGNYNIHVWHPQLPPGTAAPEQPILLSGETTEFSPRLKLSPPPPMMRMHMGHY
jgi:plastocyanin